VIRDVVLHINNEQPLRADLFELPEADTVLLRCTNIRTLNGTRPIFIDDLHSIVFFPMLHLRFIEICPGRRQRRSSRSARRRRHPGPGACRPLSPNPKKSSKSTKDFLRKVREAYGFVLGRRVPFAGRPAAQGGGGRLPAVPKNLVIVESPAKARTIERYLGPDYRVLASYGHVRDLPENPGKGKFGVDVDHDFEPEYVVSDDRRKQVARSRRPPRARTPSISRPTSTARARRSPGTSPRPRTSQRQDAPGDVQRDHRARDPRAFANPRDIDQNLVDASRPGGSSTGSSATRSAPAVTQGARRAVGRARPVGRRRLVVEREREINAFVAREYWTLEAILSTDERARFRRRARPDRRRGARHRRRRDRRASRRRPRASSIRS
jgi:hypothetical protein